MPIRLSNEKFARLVDEALASLPEEFLPYMENVSVEIQPRADDKLRREMELDDRTDLLGYYRGVPLTEKSVSAPWEMPEQVIIFQHAIEDCCNTPDQVVEEVRKTVLHEVGHHFGMDEDDLDELGY